MNAPPMTEDQLLRNILDRCRMLGLYVAHFRPAQSKTGRWLTAVQGDGKGYPDLTIVGAGGVLFRELKTERGVLRPEQKAWLGRLAEAGADCGVWKPRDLLSGRVDAELSAVRRRVVAA